MGRNPNSGEPVKVKPKNLPFTKAGTELKQRASLAERKMTNRKWVVYLLRCVDGSLYCGITNNLEKRLLKHNSGKGAKYTRSRTPVKLVGVSSEMTKNEALKLEYRLKRTPASDKMAALEVSNAG